MLVLSSMGLHSCKKKSTNSAPPFTLDSALSYVPNMAGIKYLNGTDSVFDYRSTLLAVNNWFDTFYIYVINDTEISISYYTTDTLTYASYNNVNKTIEFDGSYSFGSLYKFNIIILYFYQNDSINYKEYDSAYNGEIYVSTLHTY